MGRGTAPCQDPSQWEGTPLSHTPLSIVPQISCLRRSSPHSQNPKYATAVAHDMEHQFSLWKTFVHTARCVANNVMSRHMHAMHMHWCMYMVVT